LSLRYDIYNVKYLFACIDDYFGNLVETIVLPCDMITYGLISVRGSSEHQKT